MTRIPQNVDPDKCQPENGEGDDAPGTRGVGASEVGNGAPNDGEAGDGADEHDLRAALDRLAAEAGFDVLRVTVPDRITAQVGARLETFVDLHRHGEMDWMATTLQRRRHPLAMWRDARSIIMLGMNYGPQFDPMPALAEKSNGVISCYAKGKDYHTIIKTRLKRVAGAFHRLTDAKVKVFVDTAPLMEKPAAAAAGLGWQGKHTNLVSRDFGSWLFLGAILTTAQLAPDEPERDHCGSCRNCLDICPTGAFPAPYQLDARRCISYLTIEYKGHIDEALRPGVGNHIFGCDDCLAVCPWNKFARTASETRLLAREAIDNPPLADLLPMDEAAFASRFAGTPIKRAGRDCFIRNVLIAAGNSADASLLEPVLALLDDKAEVVRAMAVWAARRLMDGEAFARLRQDRLGAAYAPDAGDAIHAAVPDAAAPDAAAPDAAAPEKAAALERTAAQKKTGGRGGDGVACEQSSAVLREWQAPE